MLPLPSFALFSLECQGMELAEVCVESISSSLNATVTAVEIFGALSGDSFSVVGDIGKVVRLTHSSSGN